MSLLPLDEFNASLLNKIFIYFKKRINVWVFSLNYTYFTKELMYFKQINAWLSYFYPSQIIVVVVSSTESLIRHYV